jgi:HK97 family phage major capsid protein
MENLEEIKKEIASAVSGLKSKSEGAESKAIEAFEKADGLLKEVDLSKKEIETLRKELNTLAANMNKPNAKSVTVEAKSFEKAFIEQWNEKSAQIKEVLENREKGARQHGDITFNLDVTPFMQSKAAVTIGLDTTVETGSTQYTITENTGIISPIRQRVLTYLQNVSVGSIAKEYALWVEETDQQGTPIFIGEGDTKTAVSVIYVEKTAKAKKIAVHSKVTMEFMEDLPQLISFIQSNMMRRVDTVTENQLFNGNNTGDNLQGLVPVATAFTGGDLAGSIPVATINDWDVMLGVISQVKKANGIVNSIFVSNGKLDAMRAAKDLDGQYIRPEGVLIDAQGNVTAWGVRLIGTNALPSNGSVDFVGGDLNAVNVRFRKGMTVSIGESGDDFVKNLKTILVEQRLVQFVSANDTPVLVKGTFAAAKTLLSLT